MRDRLAQDRRQLLDGWTLIRIAWADYIFPKVDLVAEQLQPAVRQPQAALRPSQLDSLGLVGRGGRDANRPDRAARPFGESRHGVLSLDRLQPRPRPGDHPARLT